MEGDKGKTEDARSAPVSVSRGIKEQIAQLDSEVLEEKVQKLYDQISVLIRRSIGGEPFTADKIAFVIATITRALQDFSEAQAAQLTGVEKQAIALNLAKHILKDFRANGQLSEEAYQDILISVTVMGPTLINLVVSAWKKAKATAQDIQQHGCAGCTGRNCCVQ